MLDAFRQSCRQECEHAQAIKVIRNAGIIILKSVGRREWLFEFPRITEKVDDTLDSAIDWMRCQPAIARRMFRSLIRDYPEHLDAYHHLALAYYRDGKLKQAIEVWKSGVEFALKLFPPTFSMKRARLLWDFTKA